MTREEFIRRWRAQVQGTIALGTTGFRRSLKEGYRDLAGVEEFGRVLGDLTETTEHLLGRIYDDLVKHLPKGQPNENKP